MTNFVPLLFWYVTDLRSVLTQSPCLGLKVTVPEMTLPAKRPDVILPVVVASVDFVCLILKPFAVDVLPLFHLIVSVPIVGLSLLFTTRSVWQLPGTGFEVCTNFVVPDVTVALQPETVPDADSLHATHPEGRRDRKSVV